jgi:hypothetical protein
MCIDPAISVPASRSRMNSLAQSLDGLHAFDPDLQVDIATRGVRVGTDLLVR